MSLRLYTLPTDVLKRITGLSDASSLIRLWRCGNYALCRSLGPHGGIWRIALADYCPRSTSRLPMFLMQLSKLTKLTIHRSTYRVAEPEVLWRSLSQLHQLLSLNLQCYEAEECFMADMSPADSVSCFFLRIEQEAIQDPPARALRPMHEAFPQLESLELFPGRSLWVDEMLAELPDTLTRLSLTNSKLLTANSFRYLPRSLLSFSGPEHLKPTDDDFQYLPRGLEDLNVIYSAQVHWNLKAAPSSLTRLNVPFAPACVPSLPATLTEVYIMCSDEPLRTQSSLYTSPEPLVDMRRFLSMTTVHAHSSWMATVDQSLLQLLPLKLHTLDLGTAWITNAAKISLPATVKNLTCSFDKRTLENQLKTFFPPSLTVLTIYHAYNFVGIFLDYIEKHELRTFHVMKHPYHFGADATYPDIAAHVSDLPRAPLTSLHLDSLGMISATLASALPRTITSLSLRFLKYENFAGSRLPPLLRELTLTCPGRWLVDDFSSLPRGLLRLNLPDTKTVYTKKMIKSLPQTLTVLTLTGCGFPVSATALLPRGLREFEYIDDVPREWNFLHLPRLLVKFAARLDVELNPESTLISLPRTLHNIRFGPDYPITQAGVKLLPTGINSYYMVNSKSLTNIHREVTRYINDPFVSPDPRIATNSIWLHNWYY